MAIKGNLSEASLPDVLQLLAMGQKTGCLSVTDRANFGYLFFERGRITFASLVNRKDRLGDLLVKNGLLGREELEAAVAEQGKRPQERLGELLIERGAITRDQLEEYVRLQIEEAVYLLFTWHQGSFYFEPDQRPEQGALLVSINPENLLLEGARRVDEWGLIEKKIPELDLVFELDHARLEEEDLELGAEQRKIIPLLDGVRSVREVVEESGLVEFDVAKALFGLIQAGFAHPVGRKRQESRAVPAGRVDDHLNLGVAFYRTGMYEEAVREFRRVRELAPKNVNARFYRGLIGLRAGDQRRAVREFKEVLELGGPKPAALHDLALALEGLGRCEEARASLDEALLLAPGDPLFLLSSAVLALKEGLLADALSAFESYREAVGKKEAAESYYVFAGAALALAGELDRAASLLAEGAGRYPHSAPLHLHLGVVEERRGHWEEAEAGFRRAAEEDSLLAQAHRGLGEVLYRRGDYESAAESLKRAAELRPPSGDEVYVKLGNIHYKRMEREEAMRFWRKALEINPANRIVRTNLELVASMES
ncbi:MAG: DUF4388 domain-containing protein [Longimicrobiaceae bacterium]